MYRDTVLERCHLYSYDGTCVGIHPSQPGSPGHDYRGRETEVGNAMENSGELVDQTGLVAMIGCISGNCMDSGLAHPTSIPLLLVYYTARTPTGPRHTTIHTSPSPAAVEKALFDIGADGLASVVVPAGPASHGKFSVIPTRILDAVGR